MNDVVHRFTIKELKENSDEWVLYQIANDRWGQLENPYSPLSQRLERIMEKLSKQSWENRDKGLPP